jgi:hypothetical protein
VCQRARGCSLDPDQWLVDFNDNRARRQDFSYKLGPSPNRVGSLA